MRLMKALLYPFVILAGCATADRDLASVDSGLVVGGEDAADVTPDAAVTPPDSGSTPDSGTTCTVMTRDLLTNGNFDGAPIGTGWTEIPVDPMYPLVTALDGVPEHSAPNKAWLGGIAQAGAQDALYQDVAVPASTTMLVLTGSYDVRTSETGTTVYDQGRVEITTTSGTAIESILALSNATPKTAWQPINHQVAANVAGQTIRLRFTSTNDILSPTSFYFDSLTLQATYCE